jgi:hypothetical protein
MAKKELKEDMTLEEARAYRASLYKPEPKALSVQEKKEQFRLFWARAKRKYASKTEDIEKILWIHLMATGNDAPENFEKGLQHFGLKKIG